MKPMTDEDRREIESMTDAECWEALKEVFAEQGHPIPEHMVAATPLPMLMDLAKAGADQYGMDPAMLSVFERGFRHVQSKSARN